VVEGRAMAFFKVLVYLGLVAGKPPANLPFPTCALRVLEAGKLAGVNVPPDLQVYFITPRLIIGRKASDEVEWLRILARDSKKVVGTIAIRIEGETAQIPIYLDRYIRAGDWQAQGQRFMNPRLRQGLGTEAKKAALDYVFQEKSVRTVYARVLGDNAPSIAFHRKLGFVEIHRDEAPPYFRFVPGMRLVQ
jgi:RimJ/RimL family protein N-acetyltransferase